MVAEQLYRQSRQLARQKKASRRKKLGADVDEDSTEDDDREYDHTEIRCKAQLKAIAARLNPSGFASSTNVAKPWCPMRNPRWYHRACSITLLIG